MIVYTFEGKETAFSERIQTYYLYAVSSVMEKS